MIPKRGKIEFRVIHDHDRDFLFRVYASTREWEFQHTNWKEEDKQAFLESQFKAQDASYKMMNLGAIHRIITLDGTDIGRLIVDRQDDQLRIIDLSILTEYRGRGIGTDILRSLLNEAHGGKVPVRLHVEKQSPALRMYLRHGFRQIGDTGHHYAMEWKPATGPREI